MDTLTPIGQPAPDFTLPDLNGKLHRLSLYRGRLVLLNFWSAECPHVARSDRDLVDWMQSWDERVLLLPVASNVNEPPELLQQVASERGLPLVLHDPRLEVADLYGVQITPHYFVIDRDGILRYHGAFDDVTFRRRTPTRNYLRQAVAAVLHGGTPEPPMVPAYGCTLVRYPA